MRIKKIGDVVGMKVYTDSGEYFGEDDIVRIEDDYKRD